MKKLLAIIAISLCFTAPSKANDISDFEIEGMSIGDSLLDFYNENEINKNYWPHSKKYYYSWFTIDDSNQYSEVQVMIKDNDKKYIIEGLRAGKTFPNKIDECLKEKDKLIKEIKQIIGNNVQLNNYPKYEHSNSYPNSFVYSTQFDFKNNDLIRIYCLDWSTKVSEDTGWKDNLSLSISTSDYRKFLSNF